MAQQRGVYGHYFTGQLGKSVVGLTWKDKKNLREYKIPANPKTPAQIFQRDRFSFIVFIAGLFLDAIVRVFWKQYENNTTAFNEFCKYNIKEQPEYIDPGTPFAPDFSKIFTSKGALEPLTSVLETSYAPVDGQTYFAWEPTHFGNGLDTDLVVITVIDTINDKAYVYSAPTITRVSTDYTAYLPINMVPANLKCYLFAWRMNGNNLLSAVSQFHQMT